MASLENEYHIIPDINGGWSIKKSGSQKKLFHFKTKPEAIHKATKIGEKNKYSVVIHKKDGSVQEKKY